jgi:putative endonuclease
LIKDPAGEWVCRDEARCSVVVTPPRQHWRVYIVVCKGGAYYCGATVNIEKRIATHNAGKGAKFTRSRLPVALIANSRYMTRSNALKLEAKVKKAKKADKVRLVAPFAF